MKKGNITWDMGKNACGTVSNWISTFENISSFETRTDKAKPGIFAQYLVAKLLIPLRLTAEERAHFMKMVNDAHFVNNYDAQRDDTEDNHEAEEARENKIEECAGKARDSDDDENL